MVEAISELLYPRGTPISSLPVITSPAMQKPLALSIAVCLGLTGCQVFKKSEAWDKVSKVRPEETRKDPDPSAAYAAKLHHALAGSRIEHKVVTYQFRYLTHLREEAVGTRTAVVYRDTTNSKYPWWLKDDRLSRPFWLPNGDLGKQVAFYIRSAAEVLEHKDYSGRGTDGKTALAAAHPAFAPQHPTFSQHRSVAAKVTPAPKALVSKPIPHKEPVAQRTMAKTPAFQSHAAKKPVATRVVAKAPAAKPPEINGAIAPEKHAATIRFRSSVPAPKRIAASENLPPPPIAAHSSAPWAAPTELAGHQQPKEIVPVDEHLEKRFREETGTDYNPASPADRRKMLKLKRAAAAQD